MPKARNFTERVQSLGMFDLLALCFAVQAALMLIVLGVGLIIVWLT